MDLGIYSFVEATPLQREMLRCIELYGTVVAPAVRRALGVSTGGR